MPKKRSKYQYNIGEVNFIGVGTNEDTTRVLQGIILNHLIKDGIINDKMLYDDMSKVKSIYELENEKIKLLKE